MHEKDCNMVLISCPNKCDAPAFPKKEIMTHLKICPNVCEMCKCDVPIPRHAQQVNQFQN
jgi:hypothetical protein